MEKSNIESVILNVDKMLVERGMSIPEFCKKAGFSSNAYRYWQKGIRTPTNKSIKQMADALDVPVELLFQERDWKVVEPFDHMKHYETGIASDGKALTVDEILSSLETLGTIQLVAIRGAADSIIQERNSGTFTDPDSLRAQRGEK